MKAIEAEMKRREEEARKKAEAQKKTFKVTNLGNISFGNGHVHPVDVSPLDLEEEPHSTEGASTNQLKG